MRRWMVIVAGMVVTFVSAAVWAEPVAVNQGSGQGFVFSFRGHCYLMLPFHVHEPRRTASLATAAPSSFGEADIFRSFAPATDLSVGLVRPGLEQRCRARWEDLPDRTDDLLDRTDQATLVRVSAGGAEERLAMRITGRDLDTLRAVPVDQADEIYAGTSGAMLQIDGAVVGMAIQSGGIGEARFLRMDKIKTDLERLLEVRSAEPAPPAAAGGVCPSGGIPIAAISCSREPLDPENGCSNLLAGLRPAVMAPGPLQVTVELAVPEPVPVAEVTLQSNPEEGASAAPKTIAVEVDSSSGARPRWRFFADGDMTPFGVFKATNGSAPFARRLRLAIASAWDASQPVTLSCLTAR